MSQGSEPDGAEQDKSSDSAVEHGKGGRSVAEWVTLAISAVLVLGVAGLVTYLRFRGEERPPIIETRPLAEEAWQEDGSFYVPIEVRNVGDETAQQVQVEARMVVAGTPETSSFTIQFLAGGATAEGTGIFSRDPTAGDLAVDAVSFQRP